MLHLQGGQSRDNNQLLCTSIRIEPVSKSAISFLKLNEIPRGKVNGTLETAIQVSDLIEFHEQLDLSFITEVARGYLVNKRAHYTDCCTTV